MKIEKMSQRENDKKIMDRDRGNVTKRECQKDNG